MFKREKLKAEFAGNMRAMISPPSLAIWASAFILSVLAGPFGTFKDLGLGPRALFWGMVVTTSVLAGYLSRTLAAVVAGHDRPALYDLVAVGTMTVLLSPAVWGIGRLFEPVFILKMASFPAIFLCVFSVALILFTVRRFLPGFNARMSRFGRTDDGNPLDDAQDDRQTETPRLTYRLRDDLRGEILRISARDHHVDIVTEKGTQTLRMRLIDAIGQMDPVEGYCTHRSHWVARAAITRVERANAQKTWIHLANGDRVPVSRKYRPDLERAGIL